MLLEIAVQTLSTLPSKVYGWSSCSDKYKHRPQNQYVKHWAPAVAEWEAGRKICKAIGFDYGEERRAKFTEDEQWLYWYPLIEWCWGREECAAALLRVGLPIPVKSACFFCPSSRKPEVLSLAREHPDLLARALEIERRGLSKAITVKGLGRHWSWHDLVRADADQQRMFSENMQDISCVCYDGEEDG